MFGCNPKMLFIPFSPKIGKMFPNWSGYNYLINTLKPIRKLFNNAIQEHKRTLENGHPRDFIDAFLHEVKNTDDPDSSFHESKSGFSFNYHYELFSLEILFFNSDSNMAYFL